MLNCCKMSVTSLFMHLNCTLLHEVLILVWFLHIHVWFCLYFVVLRAYALLSFYWINDLKMWRRILLGITAMNTSNCHLCVSSPLACILNKKLMHLTVLFCEGWYEHLGEWYRAWYWKRCVITYTYITLGVGTALYISLGVWTPCISC